MRAASRIAGVCLLAWVSAYACGCAQNNGSDSDAMVDTDAQGGDGGVADQDAATRDGGHPAADVPTPDVVVPATCGNGALDPGEACDPSVPGHADPGLSCDRAGLFGVDRPIACAADCRGYDTSGCQSALGALDSCNDSAFTVSCASLGLSGDTLACLPRAPYAGSCGPAASCGNGVVDPGEICDPGNASGPACGDLGSASGTLGCAANCMAFDTSGCEPSICTAGETYVVRGAEDVARIQGCVGFVGTLIVASSSLSDLSGLSSLQSVSGDLIVYGNASLASLAGLDHLRVVGGNLIVTSNDALTSVAALNALERVNGALVLGGAEFTEEGYASGTTYPGNNALTSISGFGALRWVGTWLFVDGNRSLTSISGFDALTSVGAITIGYARFSLGPGGNPALRTLQGFSSLQHVDELMFVESGMADVAAFQGLRSIGLLDVFREHDLAHLHGLAGVQSIDTLDLEQDDVISSLADLTALRSVGTLTIESQGSLTSVGLALDHLDTLQVRGNSQDISFAGLLRSPQTLLDLNVRDNPNLSTLAGLENVAAVAFDVAITGNDALTSMQGLNGLSTVGTNNDAVLEIRDNTALTSLQGLDSLQRVSGDLTITGNYALPSQEAQALVSRVQVDGTTTVAQNGP